MAAAMEENRRLLTKLDSEIGDGDHGNNMHRGFQAALERLEGAEPSSPADALKAVSMALVSKVGGAAGADRKSTRPNSSHANISYGVLCLKKKKRTTS